MTQFLAAFQDFFKSIYELFASIIGTFISLVNNALSTILNFFTGIVDLFANLFKGAIDVVGGIGKFIISKSKCVLNMPFPYSSCKANHELGNIVLLSVVAAGYYIYTRQQQGKPVVSTKKTN